MRAALILLIGIFYYGNITAQSDSLISKSEVVWVDSSASPEELHRRARRWFTSAFASGKDVIQIEDKGNFELSGKAYTEISIVATGDYLQPAGKLWFIVEMYCKQGRYRYSFSNFRHEGHTYMGYTWPDAGLITTALSPPENWNLPLVGKKIEQDAWNQFQGITKDKIALLSESLKKSMLQPSPTEDW